MSPGERLFECDPRQVNFTTFVLSLFGSGLQELGLEGPAGAGKAETSLPLARNTIEVLELLEEKTKGNLTEDEGKLLSNVLFELRMNYVKLTGNPPCAP